MAPVFITVSFERREMYLAKPDTYEQLIDIAHNQFDIDPLDYIIIRYSPAGKVGDGTVELHPTAYETVTNNETLEICYRDEYRQPLAVSKPAIYLLSPTPLVDISVSVSLSKEWGFTVVYPITQVYKNRLEKTASITWTVSVSPDALITDLETGTKTTYLFWEASSALVTHQDSPLDFPTSTCDDTFNPHSPVVVSSNAIVLPFDDFIPYLESTLESLTMTPAMRTEFMVYWLSSFQRVRDSGYNFAFRFVHQGAFARAAALNIEGATPEAVARIFLLFKGVSKTSEFWKNRVMTRRRANNIDWAERIGMDVAAMRDASTFRVLEWGGMQVRGMSLDE